MKKANYLFFLFGSLSSGFQTVLIRALISTFSGNEFTLGFCLAAWLLGVAAGGFLSALFVEEIKDKERGFLHGVFLLILSSILSLLFILLSKRLLGLSPYEHTPLSKVIFISFISTLPPSSAFGFVFALSVSYIKWEREAIRTVYFFESAGSFIGGGILSAGIIPFLNHLSGWLVLSGVSLLAGFLIEKMGKVKAQFLFASLLFIISAIAFRREFAHLSQFLRLNEEIKEYRSTPVGEYSLLEREGTNYIFLNNFPLVTYPEEKASEINALLPISLSEGDSSFLFVGGSVSGEGRFAGMRRRARFVIYPGVQVELERLFYSGEVPDVVIEEPLRFIRKTKDIYDVISIIHQDPTSAEGNRFFTEEFFSSVKGRLRKNGVVVVSAGEPANYMSETQAGYLACLYRTLKEVFKEVEIFPATRFFFIASDRRVELPEMLKNLDMLGGKYSRSDYLLWEASEERREYYRREIERRLGAVQKNSMERPLLHFYYMKFLSEKTGRGFRVFFDILEKIRVWHVTGFLLMIAGYALLKKEVAGIPSLSLFGAFTVGFCGLLAEVLLAIAYQSIFGYLYITVGLFISLFMGGLTLGAGGKGKGKTGLSSDFILLFLSTLLTLLLLKSGWILKADFLEGTFLFCALNLLFGFIHGRIFRDSSSLIPEQSGRSGGIMDGVDHLGGAISAFLTSILFLPLFGWRITLLLVLFLSLAGWVLVKSSG